MAQKWTNMFPPSKQYRMMTLLFSYMTRKRYVLTSLRQRTIRIGSIVAATLYAINIAATLTTTTATSITTTT